MLNDDNRARVRANILLVEDNNVDAEWARRALGSAAHANIDMSVDHVNCLETALERLQNNDVHTIVLDLGLPDVAHGLEGIERILLLCPGMPVIVYSGSSYEQQGLAALNCGALFFFPKSSNDRDWFRSIVVHAIERHLLEENLRHVVEGSVDGMAIYNEANELLFANPAAARMLGLGGSNELVEPPFSLGTGGQNRVALNGILADVQVSTLRWNNAPAVLASLRDVTEHAGLERQLIQAQKMEAIALLVGGLAHDLNNHIMIVTGYAAELDKVLPRDSPARQDLNEIQMAGSRASTLVRRLLAFGREEVAEPQAVCPDEIVTAASKMFSQMIGAHIELTVETRCPDMMVLADSSQIEQVLVNLVINARDAMPSGGFLHLTTEQVVLTEQTLASVPGLADAGSYIKITVRDTGEGMDADVLQHAFDPFFTTKASDLGSGLGLATSYSIIKRFKGAIEVQSEPGSGTTFHVYLLALPANKSTLTPRRAHTAAPGGTETILLVEDDAGVRRLARQILEAKDYHVIEASDPIMALELGNAGIDLLVTDLVMPKMGGQDLYARLAEELPGLRALFVSGYSPELVVMRGILDANAHFLQKPFTPSELCRRVRDVLDAE